MAQTVKITPATGLLEFIGDNVANKPVLQHDNAGNLTLTLQSAKKFTIGGNLKVNGKVTMAQQTLTDGAAITWDFNNGANAKVTIGGARTLVIANMETGDTGLILVKQDGVGGRTLTLPNGSSIVGGGTYTPTATAGATDVLGVYYDGTTYWWTIGYNTVATPLTSVGITGSDFIISNSPLTANGNIALALATVNSNVGTFGSASAVPVITVNAKGLVTSVSTTAISIPTNLDSLTDVTLTSSSSGQLLQFNGSQWVNWTPNYVTTSRTLTINGTAYDLSADRSWTIQSLPSGGAAGDILAKNSATDYDVTWIPNYTSQVKHEVKLAANTQIGTPVYVSGSTGGSGTNMIVSAASYDSEMTSSKTMGLTASTGLANDLVFVITEGLLAGLDTSMAVAGDPVWLGPNGTLLYGLANKPYAPRHLVFLGIVTRVQQNNGEIFVKVQNGYELSEIHDVDLITTVPVNGHILGYNGTIWVNKTIAQWLGFTPANDANVVHTNGNESIAGIKTFSNTTQATSTSTGAVIVSGGVGISKNLYVGGDLNVVGNLVIGGTTTTVNAQNLAVSDNMIYLNNGILTTITNAVGNGTSVVYTTQEAHNYVTGMSVTITGITPSAYNLSNQTITAVSTNSFTIANSATGTYSSGGTARAKSNANPDLGFAGGYNDGSYAHTGLFRDATDNVWKFFKGYTPEPDASPFIDTAHASFAYADLRAYDITGNSFIKSGGTSSQFLKADGSVDSSTYLTTGTASSTYQPLDGDLTAIAALTGTGFLKRTGTNTWAIDTNTYLTSYTETDTLATVTARGASTSTAVTFNANVTLGNQADLTFVDLAGTFPTSGKGFDWTLNNDGARIYAIQPSSDSIDFVFQLRDNATTNDRFVFHVDDYQGPAFDKYPLIIRGGTEFDLVDSGLFIRGTQVLTNGRVLQNVTGNISMFTNNVGYITGYTETDTLATVTARGASTSTTLTLAKVITTGLYGPSTTGNIPIWQYDASNTGYGIVYNEGSPDTLRIDVSGQALSGTPDFLVGADYAQVNGNTVWHAGNLTNLNQLSNGPGYITGYTETDTLASVTGRGATTGVDTVFTGGLRGRKDQIDHNYTTAALWTESYGSTTTGIAFHISGIIGKFLEMRPDGRLYWDNNQVWDSNNLTNLNQLTNGPGYITSSALTPYATQTYVTTQINNLVNGAPGLLDTLDELAAALGDDANFATTVTTSINGKVSKSGDTMTGNLAFSATSGLGLTWGLNTDAAFIRFVSSGNQAGGSYLEIGTQDDLDEEIKFTQSGALRFYLATDGFLKNGSGYKYVFENGTWGISISGNSATTSQTEFASLTIGGRPVATQDWVTGQGYLTSYSESDTLATVTARGATTTSAITVDYIITNNNGNGTNIKLGDDVWIGDVNLSNTTRLMGNQNNANGYLIFGNADTKALGRAGTGALTYDGNTIYHSGNLTNLNQLTNGPGYITSSGRAYPRRSDGTNIDFYWSGQSGQPTWLWGSNDGVSMYVWNPSNFSVNYANSAGSAGYADEAKWITFPDGPRDLSDRRPNWNNRSVAWDFVTAGTADGVGNYAGVMTFSPWDGTTASTGDSSYQLGFINESGVNANGLPGLRLRHGIDSVWNTTWYQIWHSGHFTSTNISNWNVAYNKRPTSIAFSGTSTKTLTLTLGDGSTLTANFNDIDTDTNTDQQTLSISGSTLTISNGNSVTLPTGGISQATADSLYVNVAGDTMTGNLYVQPSSANPAQIILDGTNPEMYVSARAGTARLFINRQSQGNQATLHFTTGLTVTPGSAWNSQGLPLWTMGMTNNGNTDAFKLAYGDIYDQPSVALEITSGKVVYFTEIPYAAGNLVATRTWVQSQGYLTAFSETDTLASVTGRGSSTSTAVTFNGNVSVGTAASLSFGSQTRQMINLWSTGYGIGVQSSTTYFRSDSRFSWHRGGSHNDGENNPGGGTVAMSLDSSSNLAVTGSITASGGNTVWHAGNDGAGSGLDADLLDGYTQDTSAVANTIVRRDSSGNIYGNYVLGTYAYFSSGNSENPTIGQIWTQNTSDSYLRKSTPAHFRSQIIDGYYLPLSGGTLTGGINLSNNNLEGVGHIIMADSGFQEGIQWENWFICDAPDNNANTAGNLQFVYIPDNGVRMTFATDGTLTVSNRLVELSSIRYKTQVESLTPALDKVMHLRPVTYVKLNGTGQTEIGLIAEEVAEIYPELIKYNEEGQVDGINYTRIAPILIKTIQEQQELIKKLTKRIDDLENR